MLFLNCDRIIIINYGKVHQYDEFYKDIVFHYRVEDALAKHIQVGRQKP